MIRDEVRCWFILPAGERREKARPTLFRRVRRPGSDRGILAYKGLGHSAI